MNAGTMNANFFRDNLDWLGKAVNWSKFTATAALGVIHRGDLENGQTLLKPYLPKDTVEGANTGSVYSQEVRSMLWGSSMPIMRPLR